MRKLFNYTNQFGWRNLTLLGVIFFIGTHPQGLEKVYGIQVFKKYILLDTVSKTIKIGKS